MLITVSPNESEPAGPPRARNTGHPAVHRAREVTARARPIKAPPRHPCSADQCDPGGSVKNREARGGSVKKRDGDGGRVNQPPWEVSARSGNGVATMSMLRIHARVARTRD